MEHAIWLIIVIALFAGAVWGGFWVIARAQLPKLALWIFGGIVLIIIIFALIALVNGRHDFWPGWITG